MILDLKYFLIRFLLLAASLFIVHYLLLVTFPHFISVSSSWLIEMYLFLGLLTIIHYISLLWLFKKWPIYSGFLFTALSFLKMGIAIAYLFPYIFPATPGSIPIALNFMAVYLSVLAYEIINLTKNMLKKQLF